MINPLIVVTIMFCGAKILEGENDADHTGVGLKGYEESVCSQRALEI